jgi:hypothetical protein
MKFVKKPVEIEAVQWFPDPNYGYFEDGEYYNRELGYDHHQVEYTILDVGIPTLEGFMHIKPGDWIITGVKGERYPCKPDIFEMTYDPVE